MLQVGMPLAVGIGQMLVQGPRVGSPNPGPAVELGALLCHQCQRYPLQGQGQDSRQFYRRQPAA